MRCCEEEQVLLVACVWVSKSLGCVACGVGDAGICLSC